MTVFYLSDRGNKTAKLLAAGGGSHVSDIAISLNTTESAARGIIGGLRHKGFPVKNLGRSRGEKPRAGPMTRHVS
jgi:hypothetical protein